jgi:hypothetical protein
MWQDNLRIQIKYQVFFFSTVSLQNIEMEKE